MRQKRSKGDGGFCFSQTGSNGEEATGTGVFASIKQEATGTKRRGRGFLLQPTIIHRLPKATGQKVVCLIQTDRDCL